MFIMRYKQYRMDRKAAKIQAGMEALSISRIVLTKCDLEVFFRDEPEAEAGMALQAFATGTPTKRFLRKHFGNYTYNHLGD